MAVCVRLAPWDLLVRSPGCCQPRYVHTGRFCPDIVHRHSPTPAWPPCQSEGDHRTLPVPTCVVITRCETGFLLPSYHVHCMHWSAAAADANCSSARVPEPWQDCPHTAALHHMQCQAASCYCYQDLLGLELASRLLGRLHLNPTPASCPSRSCSAAQTRTLHPFCRPGHIHGHLPGHAVPGVPER